MEENKKTTEANAATIVPQEKSETETRLATLEAEKAKLLEENANYKVAYLKEAKKNKEDADIEDQDDKMRRIAKETLAGTRLAEIAEEQDALLQKILKENSELRKANSNKPDIAASSAGSTETTAVKDTTISSDQLNAFKARGWNDKDIERYKKNLQRYR